MKLRNYFYFLFLGGCVPSFAFGQAQTAHLSTLNQTISVIQKNLTVDKQLQQHQQSALATIETQSAQVAITLHQVDTQMQKENNKIKILEDNAAGLQKKINEYRQALARNVRAAYKLGNAPNLKWLLGQDDITQIERNITYYDYLNKEQINQINQIKQLLDTAQQNLEQLRLHYQTLSQLEGTQRTQLGQMTVLKTQRKEVIKTIEKQINTQQTRLLTLIENKHRLETTLDQLTANKDIYPAIGKPFEKLQHHLSWPTKGKFIKKFGTNIEQSQLRWEGVLFEARMNQPVYAIADGKVLFARWLPGYGLLMIIYHGHGYMTLYGRNQYLYKNAGDTVQAGDEIAAVGETGGYPSPALYFAIRHYTTPINPNDWFAHS